MRILLTGATGFIGGAIARAARASGHTVFALTRGGDVEQLRPFDGIPVRGDLRDPASLERAAGGVDAVIHAGHTQSADAAATDRAAAETFVRALRGSTRPFLYTSGVWVLGATGDVPADETAPRNPSAIVAWRGPLEERLVAAATEGTRTVIIRPGIAYGYGGGIPGMLVREAADSGRVRVIGDGRQEWPVVHVDDLGQLYVRALNARAGSIYNGVAAPSYTMRDLAVAACVAARRDPKIESWPLEAARDALGVFADVLALNQRVTARRAERELGWRATHASILEELLAGSAEARRNALAIEPPRIERIRGSRRIAAFDL